MSGVISDNTVRSSGAIAPLSSATTDANDPAVDTNPTDGVGTKWINTTSGEIFICIDATADTNQWIGQTTTKRSPIPMSTPAPINPAKKKKKGVGPHRGFLPEYDSKNVVTVPDQGYP